MSIIVQRGEVFRSSAEFCCVGFNGTIPVISQEGFSNNEAFPDERDKKGFSI
jgi:hypothetical protein